MSTFPPLHHNQTFLVTSIGMENKSLGVCQVKFGVCEGTRVATESAIVTYSLWSKNYHLLASPNICRNCSMRFSWLNLTTWFLHDLIWASWNVNKRRMTQNSSNSTWLGAGVPKIQRPKRSTRLNIFSVVLSYSSWGSILKEIWDVLMPRRGKKTHQFLAAFPLGINQGTARQRGPAKQPWRGREIQGDPGEWS